MTARKWRVSTSAVGCKYIMLQLRSKDVLLIFTVRVAEPWIVPSVFEAAGPSAIDEYTIGEAGYDLTGHWSSWITEGDFAQIAAAGLNHVRIPIGYWSVVKTPPYNFGALDYLDQAVQWARTYGIKVLVDLHGASLSQNGFDNSGKKGNVEWGSSQSYNDTLSAIAQLAQRYKGDTDTVTLIELLNEPLPNAPDTYISLDELEQFYRDGFGDVYNDASNNYVTVFHDAFQGVGYWNSFASGWPNMMLDTHIYYVFDDGLLAQTQSERISTVCSHKSDLASGSHYTIVGEWCSAATDCAYWLNGRYVGARSDGSYSGGTPNGACNGLSQGSVATLTDAQKSSIRQMNEAQIDSYNGHTGWIFWTWKTEGAPEWDLQAQLGAGLFPQPIDTSREFGTQC